MATDSILIKVSTGSTPEGVDLVNTLGQFLSLYNNLKSHFDRLHQLSDLNQDFGTPSKTYGTVDEAGAISTAMAQQLYNELNSLLAGTGPHNEAIRQLCAKVVGVSF